MQVKTGELGGELKVGELGARALGEAEPTAGGDWELCSCSGSEVATADRRLTLASLSSGGGWLSEGGVSGGKETWCEHRALCSGELRACEHYTTTHSLCSPVIWPRVPSAYGLNQRNWVKGKDGSLEI